MELTCPSCSLEHTLEERVLADVETFGVHFLLCPDCGEREARYWGRVAHAMFWQGPRGLGHLADLHVTPGTLVAASP